MDFSISRELQEFKVRIREVVENELKPHDNVIEQTGRIPRSGLEAIRKQGLFGSSIPKEYGGLGLDMLGNCVVIGEIAKAHIAYFYTYSMNVHIATKGIELYGTEAQRRRWLPGLATGRVVGSFALTEERAGSDAAAVQTIALREGDNYALSGRKRYITNAPIAGLFTVFAATGSDGGRRRISAFVVERETPGLRIGDAFPMAGGNGAVQAEVIFENCRVPAENRLGEEGDGFAVAMQALDIGRICWAAYCVGAAEQLLEMTLNHLTQRHQFGKPLAANQGVQWMLADMASELHGARLVCYDAAFRYDHEPSNRARLGATAKLVASEMASRMADRTVQLFGGEGYRKDRPIERIWREVRVVRILEGTSEIMRHIIARELFRDTTDKPDAFCGPSRPAYDPAVETDGSSSGVGS